MPSYRFGLSPSDIVLDARGNVLNTTLTLYVLEADAAARTNPLASVPVSSGNWSYTSGTYKSLWARTATSDKFPIVSVDAQIASLGTAVNVTDNADGGFTLSGFKLGGWQWAKDTFVSIANAVSLSTATPAAATTNGTAGTALTAARGDHSHPGTGAINFGTPLIGSGTPIGGVLSVYHQPTGPSNGVSIYNGRGPINALPVFRRLAIKEFNIKISTAGSGGAGATTAFAIYAVSASTGLLTGAPVYTSSFISTTSTGLKSWTGLNIVLDPGLYYVVLNSKGFTTRPLPSGVSGNLANLWLPGLSVSGSAGADAGVGFMLDTVDETTGAFPSSPVANSLNWTSGNPSAFWYGYQADAA